MKKGSQWTAPSRNSVTSLFRYHVAEDVKTRPRVNLYTEISGNGNVGVAVGVDDEVPPITVLINRHGVLDNQRLVPVGGGIKNTSGSIRVARHGWW
jgi:hypothetical protein